MSETKVPPNRLEIAGRLYGLQEAAVIAGETTIGLAIYERVKFIEANASTAPDPRIAAADAMAAADGTPIAQRVRGDALAKIQLVTGWYESNTRGALEEACGQWAMAEQRERAINQRLDSMAHEPFNTPEELMQDLIRENSEFTKTIVRLRERERVLREDTLREAAGAMCLYCQSGHEPRFAGLPGVTNKWAHAPSGEDVWTKDKTCKAPQIRTLIAALATPAPQPAQPKENI